MEKDQWRRILQGKWFPLLPKYHILSSRFSPYFFQLFHWIRSCQYDGWEGNDFSHWSSVWEYWRSGVPYKWMLYSKWRLLILFPIYTSFYPQSNQCLQKNKNDQGCGKLILQTKNLPFVFFVLSTVCISPIYPLLYLSHI